MRPVPPPDFRHVGFTPTTRGRALIGRVSNRRLAMGLACGMTSAATIALAAPTVVSAAVIGGLGLTAMMASLGARLKATDHGATDPFSIVPWGVIVHSDGMPRVLRWPAISSVQVEFVCFKDAATPLTRHSIVTLRVGPELLSGLAPGMIALERLETHLEAYASEASRPTALELDGEVWLDSALEPRFERLLAAARRALKSGALPGVPVLLDYRQHSSELASGAEQRLREILQGRPSSPTLADARALAAIVAAELKLDSLAEQVAALALSPEPLLAAVARAAAVKLGVKVQRVGEVREVTEFLPIEDLELIRSWLNEA